MKESYISTDKSRIDFDWLVKTLKAQYWGSELTEKKIREQVDASSLCFGLYFPHKVVPMGFFSNSVPRQQIAFARVITDKVSLSVILDVVVDEMYRRNYEGTRLMNAILSHEDIKKTYVILGTKDAWRFYEKFKFRQPAQPMMQRDPQ